MDADFTLKGRVYRRTDEDDELPFDYEDELYEVIDHLVDAFTPLHASMSIAADGSLEIYFSIVDEPT